ncbi:ABC transporter substrate-binding protein [Frigidibacter sp. ROC022]|uniref:ABC transporter substrate-binding protein n=1 Tax=Frigidibacter sp. ROC022 TaxID=2971796 RepID=UPI00215A35DA|nr:ABC transporter substrate-binding protein [Frigidibacter sp. ROC022]MCR8724604.1 ABC transporter substrate-binding protein [Frigidibacter sp. ROC022]
MKLTRRGFVGRTGAAIAGATFASGIGKSALAQDTDTLRVAYSARGLRTIDPQKSIQGVDNNAIIHIYDKLVDLPNWHFPKTIEELVPRLATSWTSTPDAKSWTLQLRKGVKFHKGYGELTSDDVKFTFDRVRDSDRVGGVRPKFKNIEEVTVDGPYSVTFKLKRTDPLFLLGVLSDYDGAIMSRKAVEDKGEEAIGMDPIGSGPYMLETVHTDPGQGITVVANPDYWDEAPATPRIQFMYIADTTARTLAILSGDVHMIDGVRAPGWADSIKSQAPDLLFDVVSPGSFFTVHFNLTVKPFDDVRVRQAFFYGIDRDEITQALAPFGKRTYGLNPPSFPGGFNADTIPADVAYVYNPDKAKELLAEAGYPDGFTFQNDTSQREDYSSIMLMIQDQLRRIGVNMELNIKDHTAFHAGQNAATNTLSQMSSALPPVPTQPFIRYLTPEAVVKPDGNGGQNFSRYGVAMPGIDDLLNKALDESDLTERLRLVQEIDAKMLRDAVLLPISDNGWMMVRSPKLDLGFEVVSGYVNWPLTKARIIG